MTLYLLIFIFGFLFGFSISLFISKKKAVGYLRIDYSDPFDKPLLFLELESSIDSFDDKNQVSLIIKRENFISQK